MPFRRSILPTAVIAGLCALAILLGSWTAFVSRAEAAGVVPVQGVAEMTSRATPKPCQRNVLPSSCPLSGFLVGVVQREDGLRGPPVQGARAAGASDDARFASIHGSPLFRPPKTDA